MRHHIIGNSYPVRDQIKALGCKWDAVEKAWYATDEATYLKAVEIVEGKPAAKPAKAAPAAKAAPKKSEGRDVMGNPVAWAKSMPTLAEAVATAAQHGGKAIGEAVVLGQVSCNKHGAVVGSYFTRKDGVRMMIVAAGKPWYSSSDHNDDAGDMTTGPGYYADAYMIEIK